VTQTLNQTAQSKITNSAAKVMIANILCLFTGLASQIVVANIFGAGIAMDAYLTALTIPTYLQAILLSGFSFVFIPIFVRYLATEKEDEAWALAGTVFWVVGIFLSILTILGIIFANNLIRTVAPGFVESKSQTTTIMMQIMMVSFPLMGLADLSTGIQNARGRFFWPALASGFGSLVNLAVVWIGYKWYGPFVLAWGNLFSMLTQAVIVIVPVVQHSWKRYFPINSPQIREMGRLAIPLILFGIFTRITPVFERYFASNLPNGNISYLGYASKISLIISSIIGTGIATGIFPVMAEEYTKNGGEGLKRTSCYGLIITFAIGFPALSLLSALGTPFVSVLFLRGAFTAADAQAVSRIIPYALLVIVFQMMGNILGRSFYVIGNTVTTPVIASIASMVYFLLAYVISRMGSGYVGLAIVQTIQWAFLCLTLIVIMARKHMLDLVALIKQTMPLLVAALLAAFIAKLGSSLFQFFFLQFLVGAVIGGILYFGLVYWMDPNLAMDLLSLFGFDRIKLIKSYFNS